ncbi:RNA-directed DNA polymerase, eukaryota, reverse transcriptase zinc-binding domain protein [Tanacetum coccineum]
MYYESFLRRSPRGGIEANQFSSLQTLIKDVKLSDHRDSWIWTPDIAKGFFVASVRQVIDSSILDVSPQVTRWIKVIPIKVNVFLWRLSLNKLLSRVNLDKKGIDLDSLLCPICNEDVETVTHLFFSCDMAKDLWSLLARWWGLDIPVCSNILDWYAWLDELSISSEGKVFLEGVGGLVSFAKLVTGEASGKFVNFRTLIALARNEANVAISMESVRAVSERFANSVYGFFLEKRVSYLVVKNYVKNTRSKYGLVKSTMKSSNWLLFLKFSFKDEMDAMLENGHWFIRNTPLILKNEDGLSAIATTLGTPLMLDSYTSVTCSSCKVFGQVLDECPKKIVSNVLKNLKNHKQAIRGVQVGPKLGLKPTKQLYQSVYKENSASASGKKK